jgi:hypothetical protein
MTEFQRLFLVQARSDFKVFELLRQKCEDEKLPSCHALHYLQMATEKLAKAKAWKNGPIGESHVAFGGFLKGLKSQRHIQKQLGYEGKNASWMYLIKKCGPLAKEVEDLAPAVAKDGPNPEYPWPRAAPRSTPAEFEFGIWAKLHGTPNGNQFLKLVGGLFAVAETFLD